ncbi:PREDICTED: uncharacterized protein LOC108382140 [Rhagoletis zephyria]|uniref:uncharacterized protein LOC108382140 n=1 Tax=Rhagoletis zephyria TaxID=28612 RepID=UPI000811696F|nr:PREDICTED: uncharacterized protein LOC108382140 [Rhagoletis zephyria]
MAVLPVNYPAVSLSADDLTTLQVVIMDEVFKGWMHPLAFFGVYFRPGMLLVDCKDESTAMWLKNVAGNLEGWQGPPLCTKRGDDIPPTHNLTVFLPRGADKSPEYAIGLLRGQNEGLNALRWRIINSSIEDTGLRLNVGIDEESFNSIRRDGFGLNFRFGSVAMKPWRHKSTGDSATAAEVMQVDQGAEQPEHANLEPSSSESNITPGEEMQQPAVLPSLLPTTQELMEGMDMQKLELDGRSESELRLSDIGEPMQRCPTSPL